MFVWECRVELGAAMAHHFNPSWEFDGWDPEKSLCNEGNHHVFGSCTMHLHWAWILFGAEEWPVQDVQQVGHCGLGSCVNHGLRFINIVRGIKGDE